MGISPSSGIVSGTAIALNAVNPSEPARQDRQSAARLRARWYRSPPSFRRPGAVQADIIADRAPPQFVARHAVNFPKNVPESDVNTADGGAAHDAVSVPEMLAIHHLPEMFDTRWVFTDQKLADVLNGAHHSAGVPFQRSFAPPAQTGLVGQNFDEHPVA